MKQDTIKVFCDGTGTACEWRFDVGVGNGRLLRRGDGQFLLEHFSSPEEAKHFCEAQVAKEPALIFYLMRGEDILETVMDLSHQEAREKRSGRLYGAISSTLIAFAALAISMAVIEFDTLSGHTFFVGVMVGLYVLFLLVMGNRNIEGAAEPVRRSASATSGP